MSDYKVDLNDQSSVNLMQIAVQEKISSLTREYWELHGPDATAYQLDRVTVQRAQYRVMSAQLNVSYETAKHKAWNELSDGSALDKANAAVRRAQIAAAKVAVDEEKGTLFQAEVQLTESRRAERNARNAA